RCLAVAAQNVKLARQFRGGAQTARIGVASDQGQCPPLAVTRDQDRRVRPGEALRQVERAGELVVLSLVGLLIPRLPAPHAQADLERFLQHVVALALRREWQAEAARLL